MSETVVHTSKPKEKGPNSTTENGFSVGQEVNKAKDVSDSGGGSATAEADGSRNGVGDCNQSGEQSPNKMTYRRGISFPKDSFVSGYLEPPDPWKNGRCQSSDCVSVRKYAIIFVFPECLSLFLKFTCGRTNSLPGTSIEEVLSVFNFWSFTSSR